MVAVFYNRPAIFRDARIHKLAYHAAKIGGHKEGFKAGDLLCMELLVDEAEKIEKFPHPGPEMIGSEPVRDFRPRIKSIWIKSAWCASGFFQGVWAHWDHGYHKNTDIDKW